MKHTGTIWHCPRCGHEHRRRFVSVDAVNEREAVVERLAAWIEENVEGAEVYRENGLVVT